MDPVQWKKNQRLIDKLNVLLSIDTPVELYYYFLEPLIPDTIMRLDSQQINLKFDWEVQ